MIFWAQQNLGALTLNPSHRGYGSVTRAKLNRK